ncbi:MAG: STY4851/ECs_5259 family protein [Spirochaetales bacterium]|nr:STY4851/ECs_5259 family protein [Spirochaetales bacterium]
MNPINEQENHNSTIDEVHSPFDWLNIFLQRRNIKKPDKRILYKYQVQPNEYRSLQKTLAAHKHAINSSLHFRPWASAFCLYVSEWYRREYDSHWAWDSVEQELGVELSPKNHSDIVTLGLKEYWGRPIRDRGSSGRDLLGSLFLEGGLPWPLVQSGHHFGRIVSRGLKEYYRTEQGMSSTYDIINESKEYLPNAFQTDDTINLIVGIVDHLMEMGNKYDLTNQSNPYQFLDQSDPAWRKDFPIPLDESNAQSLVNEWLIDAGKQRKEMAQKAKEEGSFHCIHQQHGNYSALKIKTLIYYPNSYNIKMPSQGLSTTRFETILYEGEHQIQHEGIVYGTINDKLINIRFQKAKSLVLRKKIKQPLSLRIMCSGLLIDKIVFDDSIIGTSTPIIFAERDDEYEFVSNTSCSIKESKALIRTPRGTKIECEKVKRVGIGPNFSFWYEIEDSAAITYNGHSYNVNLNADRNSTKLILTGKQFLFDTAPNLTYLGVPGVKDLTQNTNLSSNKLLLDNQDIESFKDQVPTGRVNLKVLDSSNAVILNRIIGVLPKYFSFNIHPERQGNPAQISFTGIEDCLINFDKEVLNVHKSKLSTDKDIYELSPIADTPNILEVKLKSPHCRKPVVLKLPYPKVGAQIIDSKNESISQRDLSLNSLLGMRLLLSSALIGSESFHMNLELVVTRNRDFHPRISYRYPSEQSPVVVNLFSLRNDMIQLLSTVKDQDAYLNISIDYGATQKLIEFAVNRYEGDVHWEQDDFTIKSLDKKSIKKNALPIAFDLSDPNKEKIVLSEIESEGVGTDYFTLSDKMQKDGPWLIVPDKDSEVYFRPRLFQNKENIPIPESVTSLHSASRHFAHFFDKKIMDEQIENMAIDFSNSGWLYMKALLDNYAHLPLSTFEPWLSLSKSNRCLAAAAFKLELNESMFNRIRDELSVLWECIPVQTWKEMYFNFKGYLETSGFPEITVNKVLENKISQIRKSVSILEHLTDYIVSDELSELKEEFIHKILPIWNQENLNKHSELNWPLNLKKELSNWSNEYPVSHKIMGIEKSLPITDYSKSVVYLPLFMARVTLGIASIEDLGLPLNNAKLNIKRIIDFDHKWFFPVHSLMVAYLLQKQ